MKEIILGIIRHILTAGGGALTAGGLATNGELEAAAGAVITIIGFVWSVLQKRKRTQTISK